MVKILFLASLALLVLAPLTFAQQDQHGQTGALSQRPCMNRSLSPDQRAGLVLKEMTLDEKIDMLHGQGMPNWGKPLQSANLDNGGAGFVLGVPPSHHSFQELQQKTTLAGSFWCHEG